MNMSLLLDDTPFVGFELRGYMIMAIVVFIVLDRAWNRVANADFTHKLTCSLERHNTQLRCEKGESYYQCLHCNEESKHVQTNRPES